MRTLRGVGILSAILITTGCAIGRTDVVLVNPDAKRATLSANEPVLLTTLGLDVSYEEIGFIRVNGVARLGYEGLNNKLRDEARQLGADAVIYIHYGTEYAFSISPIILSIPYDVLTAEGLAVRTKRR